MRDNEMWHRPVGSTAVGCSSHAVMPSLRTEWSFCCIHYSRLPMLFQWAGQPPQIAPSRDEISTGQPPSNTWFLRPIWISRPNGILIGSAVFAQLTRESNTQTQRPRYVRHLWHLCTTLQTMRPNIMCPK